MHYLLDKTHEKRYDRHTESFIISFLLALAVTTSFSLVFRYLDSHFSFERHQSDTPEFFFNTVSTLANELSLATIAEAATARKESDIQSALKLIQSAPNLVVGVKQKVGFEVGFKNTSNAPWRAESPQKITLRSGAKRESYFHDPSWESGTVVMSLKRDVNVGEVVYFKFLMEAPARSGSFKEQIFLFYGDQKMNGALVSIPITVEPQKPQEETMPSLQLQHAPALLTHSFQLSPQEKLTALKLIQSAPNLVVGVKQKVGFEVGFKNTSNAPWRAESPQKITLRSGAKRESYFHDPSWESGTVVMSLKRDVNVGEVVYFKFLMEAPLLSVKKYNEQFSLYSGEQKIKESEFFLPIVVTVQQQKNLLLPQDFSTSYNQQPSLAISSQNPQQTQPSDIPVPIGEASATQASASFIQQPSHGIIDDLVDQEKTIRIGVHNTRDPIQLTANTAYEIRDDAGMLYSTEAAAAITTVSFDSLNSKYVIITPTQTFTIVTPPRFFGVLSGSAAPSQDTIFEILSFSNRPTWSSVLNDNTFRGLIEIRHIRETDRTWVINELFVESYLKGIAETSNNSPYEYQKALIIAARTYAEYHVAHNTKYNGEFTIRSTDYDQVYRGYGAEKRLPNVARAVQETRGVEVFYNGSLVITPYYSQSDGRTLAWGEVWGGGQKPWLVSKEVPSDKGLPMLGHGVGMSARGAVAMALNGKNYEEILKYFYTGIELRRRYP